MKFYIDVVFLQKRKFDFLQSWSHCSSLPAGGCPMGVELYVEPSFSCVYFRQRQTVLELICRQNSWPHWMTHPKSLDENQSFLCEAVCWVWTLCAGRKLRRGPCWRLNHHHHLHYSSQHQSQLAVLRRPGCATEGQVQNFEHSSDQKYNTKQSRWASWGEATPV